MSFLSTVLDSLGRLIEIKKDGLKLDEKVVEEKKCLGVVTNVNF